MEYQKQPSVRYCFERLSMAGNFMFHGRISMTVYIARVNSDSVQTVNLTDQRRHCDYDPSG